MNLNSRITGVMGIADRADFYKFSLSGSGKVSVDINMSPFKTTYFGLKFVLYNSSYKEMETWEPKYDSQLGKGVYKGESGKALSPGTYYIGIYNDYMDYYYFETCKYDFLISKSSEPIKVTSISLNKTKTTLYMDGTKKVTLAATIAPTNATNKAVTWASSNTKVATVSSTGVVTAIGAGTATISATAKDGSKVAGKCTVTVKNPGIQYHTHIQTYGWEKPWKNNGEMSGTSGQSKRLEAIEIKLTDAPYSGSIEYRTHIQTTGWETAWRKDGAMSGTSGQSKRLEAIQIRLTGDMEKNYDVYYRVHAQTYGWLGWAKNGEMAGTSTLSRRLEAIQIVLVRKGSAAPGKTYQGITSVTTIPYRTNK